MEALRKTMSNSVHPASIIEHEDAPSKSQLETDKPHDSPPWLVFIVFLITAIVLLCLYGWSVSSPPWLLAELLVGAA